MPAISETTEPVGGLRNDADAQVFCTPLDMPRAGVAEDAPALIASRSGLTLLGVFDGLGGAGARKVDGGEGLRSSAYYASRLARAAVVAGFERLPPTWADAMTAAALEQAIAATLAEQNQTAPVEAGMIRSSMLRSYPTTAALLLFQATPAPSLEMMALWAGDSRAYALSASGGLQQLTRDDSASGDDPMLGQHDDAPMTNLLAGDRPGRLNWRQYSLSLPCLLLVASDGCFGCLPSPMHFEMLLLEALRDARDPHDWAQLVAERLAPAANDDVSLAAAFVGWADFARAVRDLGSRAAALRTLLQLGDPPADGSPGEAPAARPAAERWGAVWQTYRASYMQYLAPAAGHAEC